MSENCPNPIYIGSDHSVALYGLVDQNDPATYINDATVTGQLFQSDQTTAVGSSIAISYVAASNGNYRGSFTAAVTTTLTQNQTYWIRVTTVSATIQDVRWIRTVAKQRGTT